MNAINRIFVATLALAWLAVVGALIYLVWNPGEFIQVSGSTLSGRFEILTATTAEQTLATIILGLLMLPSMMLLIMEATVRDHRTADLGAEAKLERDRNKRLESRISDLEKQLEAERKHDAEAVRRMADRDVDRTERATPPRRWHLFGR
jgi:hypothetical protein